MKTLDEIRMEMNGEEVLCAKFTLKKGVNGNENKKIYILHSDNSKEDEEAFFGKFNFPDSFDKFEEGIIWLKDGSWVEFVEGYGGEYDEWKRFNIPEIPEECRK